MWLLEAAIPAVASALRTLSLCLGDRGMVRFRGAFRACRFGVSHALAFQIICPTFNQHQATTMTPNALGFDAVNTVATVAAATTIANIMLSRLTIPPS